MNGGTLSPDVTLEATRALRPRLAAWGGVLVATLAAFGLALTVLVARAGREDASELLTRGEGESLLSSVRQELLAHRGPPSADELRGILERHKSAGLRYLAVGGPRGELTEVGTSLVPDRGMKSGEVRSTGQRARIVEMLPGLGAHPPGGPGPGGPEGPGPAGPGPDGLGPPGFPPGMGPEALAWGEPEADGLLPAGRMPPLVVLEFETPVATQLRAAMDRTSEVGAVAVVVLLGAAIVLKRNIGRQAAIARAAERDRRLVALGQMSSVMAHELRNPLAALKGHAQLLVEALGEGTRERQKADRVVGESERLVRLTNDLLDFVRDGPLQGEEVATSLVLERALEGLDKDRLDLDLTLTPPAVFVDLSRIASAVSNLVRNALQATTGDERVSVRVAARGKDVVLEVRDHGAGIAPGEEERLFEPFFTTRVRGTGLGLAVARRVVEQHGGTLLGRNHPDGGAVFSVLLPGAVRHS